MMNRLYKSLLKEAYTENNIGEYYIEEFDELNSELESMGLRYVDKKLVYNNFIILDSFNLNSNVLIVNDSFSEEEISKINGIYSASKDDYNPSYDEIIEASVIKEIKENIQGFKAKIEQPVLKEFEPILQKINSIVIYEKTLEELLDDLFVDSNAIYTHKPFSRDSEEEKGDYTQITEEAIEVEGFEYQIPKYFIDAINYSARAMGDVTVDFEEYSPETEESAFREITEEDFDKARYTKKTTPAEVFDKAYREISNKCFKFIEDHKKANFYGTENSKIKVESGNFLNIVRFGKPNAKTLNEYSPSGSAIISFTHKNKCSVEFLESSNSNEKVTLYFNFDSKEIRPKGRDKRRADVKIIPEIIPNFSSESTFKFLRERLEYLVFSFLSLESNYTSPILASYITSSDIQSKSSALSGASEQGTSKYQLQILMNKVLKNSVTDPKDISLDTALHRAAVPFRAVTSENSLEDAEENIEYATREFSKSSLFNSINYSPAENRGLEGIEESVDELIQRGVSEDKSKIDSLGRLLIPSYISKIMYIGQKNLTEEYQKSTSSTKDIESDWSTFYKKLDLSSPIQQQVVAEYANDYISKSWGSISSGLSATYSELGMDLSDRQKAEFLESMQSGIIEGLKSSGTSRSLSTGKDWWRLFVTTREEMFNDFESFKLKYESENQTSAQNENKADDFEVNENSIRRLKLKKSLSSVYKTRIHPLNMLFKIAAGEGPIPAFNPIDIVSDGDNASLSKVYSYISNYSSMIEGDSPYFLPISIRSRVKVNLKDITLSYKDSANNQQSQKIMRALGFNRSSSVQYIESMFYCSNNGIVMVDEGLNLRLSGKNIFGPELIDYLQTGGKDIVEEINKVVPLNRNASISVVFNVEARGTSNEVGLIIMKNTSGEITVHVNTAKPVYKLFESVVPEIERTVMLEFSGERNGFIHRGITDSGEIKRNTNFAVDPDSFKTWSTSDPDSTFKPMVVSYDLDGKIQGLNIGEEITIDAQEGEFRARYNKETENMYDASKTSIHTRDPVEMYDPRNSRFYSSEKNIPLSELNINSAAKANPSQILPNLSTIENLSPKNKAVLSLYDPITKISFEAGIGSSDLSDSYSKSSAFAKSRYSYLLSEINDTNHNSVTTSLLEVKENLKTVKANDLFLAIDDSSNLSRVLAANANINSLIIDKACDYRYLLSQKESLNLNEKRMLYMLDAILLEIKNECSSSTDRLLTKMSVIFSKKAPWLYSGNILTFSDETLSISRSSISYETYLDVDSKISSEKFQEARTLNRKILAIPNNLPKGGELSVFSGKLYQEILGIDFNNRSFDQKISILKIILTQGEVTLPEGLSKIKIDQTIYEIVKDDLFKNIFSEDEIKNLKDLSRLEKISSIGRVNIKTMSELEDFVSKEGGRELREILETSRRNIKNSFQELFNSDNSHVSRIDVFKSNIDTINREAALMKGLSEQGKGLYISAMVIEQYIGKEVSSLNLDPNDISKSLQSVVNSYSGRPGILFDMLVDVDGDNYFYDYLMKNLSAEEFSKIKISMLEKVQPLNNLVIETLNDGSKVYSIKVKPDYDTPKLFGELDIDKTSINLGEASRSLKSFMSNNPERGKDIYASVANNFLTPKEIFSASVGSIPEDYLNKIDVEMETLRDGTNKFRITLKEGTDTVNYIGINGENVVLNRLGEGADPLVHTIKVPKSQKITENTIDIVSRKSMTNEMFNFLIKNNPEVFSSEIKVNLLGKNNEGKSIFTISVGDIFTTNEKTIAELNNYGGRYDDKFIEIVHKALEDSGVPKEELQNYETFKSYLNARREDAESLDRLRMADLARGTRSFAALYDPAISEALTKSLKAIESLNIDHEAKYFISLIRSNLNSVTGEIIKGKYEIINVNKQNYSQVTNLQKDLDSLRVHYNLNRYSNPDISNAILEKISEKFPGSSEQEIKELLFYMGFKTSVYTNLNPLTASARVSFSVDQIEALKANLLMIENIQDIRSGYSFKTDQEFAEKIKAAPKIFANQDHIALYSMSDPKVSVRIESLEDLIDFMMKEAEYLESVGNISLSSSLRSSLYSSLNYNASSIRVQVGGTFFGKRMTENGKFFLSFLGKLGIVEEDDIKRVSDLLESSKELRDAITAKEKELEDASKALHSKLKEHTGDIEETRRSAEEEYNKRLKELKDLEKKAETIHVSELDLQKARDKLAEASKFMKFRKFLGRFILACANPLNSMEFAVVHLLFVDGASLTAKVGFELLTGSYKLASDQIFRNDFFNKQKSSWERLIGVGKNGALGEEIVSFDPDESKRNSYLKRVEDKAIESRQTGAAGRRALRDAQIEAVNYKGYTFKYTKNSAEYEIPGTKSLKAFMSKKVAPVLKAAFSVVGKILGKIFIGLYAKSLWDNVTGDEAEMGIIYPSEICHNISQAFTKMKDHKFESYSCEKNGECDSNIFTENHKFELGGTENSLYHKILRSDDKAEIDGYIELINRCKAKMREINKEVLTKENINRNLNIDAGLNYRGTIDSVAEVTTLLVAVLPAMLSSAAEECTTYSYNWYAGNNENTATSDALGLIAYSISILITKPIGLLLGLANAVDVISHFSNNFANKYLPYDYTPSFIYPDKFKPAQTAFNEESLAAFDSMVDEICKTLKSTFIYKVLGANEGLSINSSDPALSIMLNYYEKEFSGE